MTHKTTAAMYAQVRRDNETNIRDKLKAKVPMAFHTDDIEEDGTLNPTAKVMLAATNYIETLETKPIDSPTSTKGEPSQAEQFHAANSTPFIIPRKAQGSQPEELRQLRQVAQRVVHKVEEQMEGLEELPEKVYKCIDKASDLLIDLIEEIEQVGPQK